MPKFFLLLIGKRWIFVAVVNFPPARISREHYIAFSDSKVNKLKPDGAAPARLLVLGILIVTALGRKI